MVTFRQGARNKRSRRGHADGAGPPAELYERNLELIERVIASIGRRRALSGDEAEDFASWVRVRLLEDDCAILAKFRGRSRFKTYLVTVIGNLFRDYRISKWGKFRPSAGAKRRGPTAERFEILYYRDGYSFDETVEILRRNFGVRESAEEIERLAASLPQRVPRRPVGEEVLEQMGDEGSAEDRVRDGERVAAAERAEEALGKAFLTLEPESRLILKMHFEDQLTVAAISRTLDLEQKPLYRRIDRCLRDLRANLEADGFTADDAADLLGWDVLSLDVEYGERARGEENRVPRPSPDRGMS
jgi:RNA polymerase sigma factor (sigma-70 family)